MVMKGIGRTVSAMLLIVTLLFIASGCSTPLQWPESPLYPAPDSDPESGQPETLEEAMEAIAGHYAHFDVVAYEDTSTATPMKNFVVSYGFTDFYIEEGRLYQKDTFVHAEHIINQPFVSSAISDEAVQAIKPRIQEVELSFTDGRWHIYRPPTPSLLGITGDASLPLATDPDDPNFVDADGDGKPGVTVQITMFGLFSGELYITRREIFTNYLSLYDNGILQGHVVDDSEQFVIGASLDILAQPSNALQHPDFGLNPIILIPIDPEIDTPEELLALKHKLFPPSPKFVQ